MKGADAVRVSGQPVGAVVMKAATPEARPGYPQPQWIWLGRSLLNAQGNPNPGYKRFVDEVRFTVEHTHKPVIVSMIASEVDEYLSMTEVLGEAEPHAFELPLIVYRTDQPRWAAELVGAVKEAARVPVIAKLWYDVDIVDLGHAVAEAGADAITVTGSLPALAIDLESARPSLGSPNAYGGLTGPCIKPLVVRCVAVLAKALNIPIIGGGGVSDGDDALELMMVGARAVSLLTAAMLEGERVFTRIHDEMQAKLQELGHRCVEDVIGIALEHIP